MATMLVKDLIESLQKLDPNLPIHKHEGLGDFKAVDIDQAGYVFALGNLMQSKNQSSYFALETDKVWKNRKNEFNKPFKAVLIW